MQGEEPNKYADLVASNVPVEGQSRKTPPVQ